MQLDYKKSISRVLISGMFLASVNVAVAQDLFTCIEDPVTGNPCGCLEENDSSGLIWYADATQTGTQIDWCTPDRSDFYNWCGTDGASVVAFNAAGHCGYSDWHVPTSPRPAMYLNNAAGSWGTLGSYALGNGWIQGNSLAQWLNNNGFTGVVDDSYWSADYSEMSFAAEAVFMTYGSMRDANPSYPKYVMLVHGN